MSGAAMMQDADVEYEGRSRFCTATEFARLVAEYGITVALARAVVDDNPDVRILIGFDLDDLEVLAGWCQSPRCLRCGSRACRRIPPSVRCDVCDLERHAPAAILEGEAFDRWKDICDDAVEWHPEHKRRWARYVAAERSARQREVDAYIFARRLQQLPVPAWARELRLALEAARKGAPERKAYP